MGEYRERRGDEPVKLEAAVDIAAMGNFGDGNDHRGVIYGVKHAIVAGANSPKVLVSRQLGASGRAWVAGKGVNSRADSQSDRLGQRQEFAVS